MSEMLDKEDPGPTYAEIQAALNAAEATITSLRAELERKDAALREITELEPRPSTLYPADWREQIAACPECQRYKDHPIQRGICDTHRRPIYATERHNEHETSILGYRAKGIARAALSAQKEEEA